MGTVTVSRIGERLVAVKRADPESDAQVRAEARLLEALDHPGLVQFIDLSDDDGVAVVRTAFAGTDTWASRPVTDPVARAGGVAAIAATLADLHERGVAHGSLRADHVIRGDDDRPILCGLSRSRDGDDDARLADLDALAGLIEDPPLEAGPRAAALTALASRIRSGQYEARDIVGVANRIASEAGRGTTRTRPHRRPLVVLGSILVLAAAGTIALAGAGPGSRSRPLADSPATTVAPAQTSRPPATMPRPRPAPEAGTAAESSPAPVDASGAAFDHDGRRYVVGQAGDVAVLGDWDCDGEPTPAVLRPATGEIAAFDRWPDLDESISESSEWTVERASSLSVEGDGTCDRLRVHTDSGSTLLDLGPAR